MGVVASSRQYTLVGFRYDGSFPLDFLRSDEAVASTNGAGCCVITSPRGHVRLQPDDFIGHRPDGSLFTTSSNSHPRDGASIPREGIADAPPGGCNHCSCVTDESPCCLCEFVPDGLRAPEGSVI